MHRKLVKQSTNTLTIALPANWIKENHLNAGNEIEINQQEADLLISAKKEPGEKKIEMSINSEDFFLVKGTLRTLYKVGYDLIKINFENEKQLTVIKQTFKDEMFGFEIIKETSKYIILESLAEFSNKKHKFLLTKIFQIAKQSFDIVLADLKTKKFTSIKEIKKLTKKADNYDSFCRRNICKNRFSEELVTFYWEFYQKLILVQYSLLHLYTLLDNENPKRISKETLEILTTIKQSYDSIYTIFFQNKLELLEDLNTNIINLRYKKVHKLMKKTKGTETIILYYCGELTRRINLFTLPLVALSAKKT
jgi:phosphate uptake regulator